ncbi:MAG: FkbM family methyltransferase [Rhodospirillales bacterium]
MSSVSKEFDEQARAGLNELIQVFNAAAPGGDWERIQPALDDWFALYLNADNAADEVIRVVRQLEWSTHCIKVRALYAGVIKMIDVGSVGGLGPPWQEHTETIGFTLNFEPNGDKARTETSLTYDTALWEHDEMRDFFVYEGFNQQGSSLFEFNEDYIRENFDTLSMEGDPRLAETIFERSRLVEVRRIPCRALDNILRDETPDVSFNFMKIDAQGAEYNILHGAVDGGAAVLRNVIE